MPDSYDKEQETGFTPKLAMEEASRCLLCFDAPCSAHCPAGTDPAKFIRSVRFQNVKGAAETVRLNNVLGAICARVCPTERYCQLGCSRCGIDKPIDIGRIQRFITDFEDVTKMEILEAKPKNGRRVAILGSGPAGLSAAATLAMDGYGVTIFEKEAKAGGYLRYGIPEYRLPQEVVDKEIRRIEKLGVEIRLNTRIDDVGSLKPGFDAVILACGQNQGKTLPLFEGKRFAKTAVDFLHEVKRRKGKVKVPENVLVIGGGDVAMDTITTVKRLGAKYVTDVVYETFDEFKASQKELEGARKENVSIIDGYVPVAVKGKKVVFHHRFLPAKLEIKADLVIMAVGQKAEYLGVNIMSSQEVTTELPVWLFACGDIAPGGEKTVVYAVKGGKETAAKVAAFLGGK